MSAEILLGKIADALLSQSKTRRDARLRKIEKEGKSGKRKKTNEAGAAEVESSNESSDEEEGVNEMIEKIQQAFHDDDSDEAVIYTADVGNGGAFKAVIKIGGHKHEALIDTGAAFSICSAELAEDLKLKPTGKEAYFVGLGSAWGKQMEPKPIEVGGVTVNATFYAIKKPITRMLIGMDTLRESNLLIDPATRRLLKRNDAAMIDVSEEQQKLNATKDVVTGYDPNATEEDKKKEARAIFDSIAAHLEAERAETLWNIFWRKKEAWFDPKPGQVRLSIGDFEVKGKPHKAKLRPLTLELKQECEKQIQEMLKAGVLRPSKSPWGAAPVFVKKKTGEWRMAIDYRPVNAQMVDDAYPLPHTWDLCQLAAGHLWYTALDCANGFWNIKLAEGSKPYTAVITHIGSYEFNVLPFGIKNSPAECQRALDRAFSSVAQATRYIDDITIWGDSPEEHDKVLEEVLDAAIASGFYFKLKKTDLFKSEVNMLGHIVGLGGVRPSPKKVQGIVQSQPPKNIKELRSFLGMAGYLRRFVPNYSALTFPLTQLTKKDMPYEWTDVHQEAFQEVKDHIASAVMLSIPKGNGPFVINTDASNIGVGAVLLQWQDEQLEPLEFASKKLTEGEARWSTSEKEAFAVVWAVKQFRDYIRTRRAYVVTDHAALQYFSGMQEGKFLRWSLYLQQYDLVFVYLKGERNVMADYLSRNVPEEDLGITEDEYCVPLYAARLALPGVWPVPRLPTLQELMDAYKTSNPDELNKMTLQPDGCRVNPRDGKLYIPPKLREPLMYWFHLGRLGQHASARRMTKRMRQWVHWPKMAQDISHYVNGCIICKRLSVPKRRYVLGALSEPFPLEMVSLDHVGPRRWNGKQYWLLVIIDHASRFMVVAPMKEAPNAINTLKAFRERWVAVFQAPRAILTDRGSAFTADPFHLFASQEMGSTHVFTSAYYPQGNAINESSHQYLNRTIDAINLSSDCDLADALESAVNVYNATPHPSTGHSPYYALFGFEPALPGWHVLRTDEGKERPFVQHATRIRNMLVKELQDENRKVATPTSPLKAGDWVVRRLTPAEQAPKGNDPVNTQSLYSLRYGAPCKVIAIKDKVAVIAHLGDPAHQRQVPISTLLLLAPEIPSSLTKLTQRSLLHHTAKWTEERALPAPGGPLKTWDDLISVPTGTTSAPIPRKRQRVRVDD